MNPSSHLILGISGASGARLGLRALALFAGSPDVSCLHLVVSPRALLVARTEIDAGISSAPALVDAAGLDQATRAKVALYPESAVDAPISSGSFRTRGTRLRPRLTRAPRTVSFTSSRSGSASSSCSAGP